jgi:hypothetical protein
LPPPEPPLEPPPAPPVVPPEPPLPSPPAGVPPVEPPAPVPPVGDAPPVVLPPVPGVPPDAPAPPVLSPPLPLPPAADPPEPDPAAPSGVSLELEQATRAEPITRERTEKEIEPASQSFFESKCASVRPIRLRDRLPCLAARIATVVRARITYSASRFGSFLGAESLTNAAPVVAISGSKAKPRGIHERGLAQLSPVHTARPEDFNRRGCPCSPAAYLRADRFIRTEPKP